VNRRYKNLLKAVSSRTGTAHGLGEKKEEANGATVCILVVYVPRSKQAVGRDWGRQLGISHAVAEARSEFEGGSAEVALTNSLR
jgi:hypothetical protein